MTAFGDRVPRWPALAGVAALSMLLGLLLCGLYAATGSLLPGLALAAVASAAGFGIACRLA